MGKKKEFVICFPSFNQTLGTRAPGLLLCVKVNQNWRSFTGNRGNSVLQVGSHEGGLEGKNLQINGKEFCGSGIFLASKLSTSEMKTMILLGR